MVRKILNDEQWARIAPELPGKKGDPGKSGTDNRLFVEAVLWVARTGSPWRDLPDDFGKWSTVYTRYWRWAQKDKWESIFKRLSEDADFEYVMIDGTIVRVHQHGAGARGGTQNQAIGRSRGGLTTKIAALVDALGNLVRFTLLPGQRHDIKSVDDLLEGIDCEAFLGDKAFDAKALRACLAQDGIEAVIPQRKGAAELIDVESRRGAVAWALWASLRFLSPLIKPDVRISRIRLPDRLHLKAHGGGPRWTRLCRITPSSPNTTVSGKPGATRRHLMAPDQEMTYSLVRSSSLIPDNQFGSPAPPSP